MIYLILKSYFIILLSVGLLSLFILVLGLYFIFRPAKSSTKASVIATNIVNENNNMKLDLPSDLAAISGDDLIATQLDLARAYLETDNKPLAKSMLDNILIQGNKAQQQEAQQLLSVL